jgi:aquaporin Z
MTRALRDHWPEYLIEGACLGLFMISASFFTALVNYPGWPLRHAIQSDSLRRALIGVAMGLTSIALIYSPWGQRSGAHLNPAVTLTFLRLGKVKPWDAFFYINAQVLGGATGVLLSKIMLGGIIDHPSINYVVTVPGPPGAAVAFAAEMALAAGMMFTVLALTNIPRVARYTGLAAGLLVALYITFEAPLSGMSINPARTIASAWPSRIWMDSWIYFTAPLLGMLLALEIYKRAKGIAHIGCPKLHHGKRQRCIFCGHPGAIDDSSVNGCKVPTAAATH